MVLPLAFQYLTDWSVSRSFSPPASLTEAGQFESHPSIPINDVHATVCSKTDYLSLSPLTTHIIVPNNCSNAVDFTSFDLSALAFLRELRIGDNCFRHVKNLVLTNLGGLQNVTIGFNSFSQSSTEVDPESSYNIRIRRCNVLKSVVIGGYSFLYFTVFDLAHLPSLERIEIASMDPQNPGGNFYFTPFELSSGRRRRDEPVDLPHLKTFMAGTLTFRYSQTIVFESGNREGESRNRLA